MTPDWTGIAAAISAAANIRFSVRNARPVGGGSVHAAWRIDDGEKAYFVKTGGNEARLMFAAEADGLHAIAECAALRTPRVLAQGETGGTAYLVLEALDLQPLDPASGARLGAALAQLHRCTAVEYGWPQDNFIGTTPQANTPHPSWPHFFADRRLRPQLQRALTNGMEKALVNSGLAIADRVGALFLEYRPAPSLLHGDLWSGNAARLEDGTPVVFDPACHWGDREADLAMSELFGGFPASFYAGYRAEWPLDKDYERRKPLYNLYHVLNHFNLFGAAYLGQARRMIESLLASLTR